MKAMFIVLLCESIVLELKRSRGCQPKTLDWSSLANEEEIFMSKKVLLIEALSEGGNWKKLVMGDLLMDRHHESAFVLVLGSNQSGQAKYICLAFEQYPQKNRSVCL